jgi:hypothetical protein
MTRSTPRIALVTAAFTLSLHALAQAPARPTVTLSFDALPAPLASAGYARAITGARPRILACYQTALRASPTLSGPLSWQLRLSPAGRITSATLLPMAGPVALRTTVATCVRSVLLSTQFNELTTAEVNYVQSITFAPR